MRILVTGASGRLGSAVVERLFRTGRHEVVAWGRRVSDRDPSFTIRAVELADGEAVEHALAEADPSVVIHAGAMSSAEEVRRDPARGREVNVEATRRLCDWAATRGRRLIFTSTDLVFDGSRSWYREDDPPHPVLAYGRSKHEAEAFVLGIAGGLVTRLSLLYGANPSGRAGFFENALEALRRGEIRTFFHDEYRTPLDYTTAAVVLCRLVESDVSGIIHVAGKERLSRFEMMRRAITLLGIDPDLVRSESRSEVPGAEARPADASLDTSKLARLLPDLDRPSLEVALTARIV